MVNTIDKLDAFRVGETYTNDQIRFSLDVENLGGIRPALDAERNIRHVAILTAAEDSGKLTSENPYRDQIEGDVLTYTAQGREGNQRLAGRNKRLIEQYSSPTPFFGFINIGRQVYRFMGLLELLRHYQEVQTDKKGALRSVWLFEFRIHDQPDIVPISEARVISAMLLEESRRQIPICSLEREVTQSPSAEGKTNSDITQVETVRSRLLLVPPYAFEHFVKRVLERCGFVQVTVTRSTGDGGVDLNALVEESDDFIAGTIPGGCDLPACFPTRHFCRARLSRQ